MEEQTNSVITTSFDEFPDEVKVTSTIEEVPPPSSTGTESTGFILYVPTNDTFNESRQNASDSMLISHSSLKPDFRSYFLNFSSPISPSLRYIWDINVHSEDHLHHNTSNESGFVDPIKDGLDPSSPSSGTRAGLLERSQEDNVSAEILLKKIEDKEQMETYSQFAERVSAENKNGGILLLFSLL